MQTFLITVACATVFQFLPDVRVKWRDVWLGAFVTAALFVVGKYAIGLYLAHQSVESTYGAAGSLVVILLDLLLGANLLLGAEFAQVYARRHGRAIVPEPYAVAAVAASRPRSPCHPRR